MLKIGNIGIITCVDSLLCKVTKIEDQIVFCELIEFKGCYRCCYVSDFWVLLDSMPN